AGRRSKRSALMARLGAEEREHWSGRVLVSSLVLFFANWSTPSSLTRRLFRHTGARTKRSTSQTMLTRQTDGEISDDRALWSRNRSRRYRYGENRRQR